MKYIKFWNVFTESMYSGFIVREGTEYFDMTHAFTRDFLQFTRKESLLPKIKGTRFGKETFRYMELTHSSPFIPEEDQWILRFPLIADQIVHMDEICIFFEFFLHYEKNERTSLFDRLVRSIKKIEKSVPPVVIKALISFIIDERSAAEEPDRLRLLLYQQQWMHLP